MSFAFLVAGFLATTNAGRVALAALAYRPDRRGRAAALLAGAAIVVGATLLADPLLDALSISPEAKLLSRIFSAPLQSPLAQRNPSTACDAQVDPGATFNASSAIITADTGSSARCASMNSPRKPNSRVSSRSAMAWNAARAASRSPSSCADCACSNSARGSFAAWRRATWACARAVVASPCPIASRPCVMACLPRA